MATRIPMPQDSELPAEIRDTLAAVPLNFARMAANAPGSFKPMMEMGGAILFQSEFDPRLREIAVLRIAHLTKANYEWVHHVTLGKAVGVTDAEVEAVQAQGAVTALDEEASLMCRVADEITRDVRLSDGALAELLKRYGNRGATELILCCSWFNLISRFLESTGVELEQQAAPG